MSTRVAQEAAPFWEILLSLQALQTGQGGGAFDGWRRQTRASLGKEEFRPLLRCLLPLVPVARYVPDFLTPSGGLEQGMETMLSTSPKRLRREMEALGTVSRLPSWTADLAAGRSPALTELVRCLHGYFRVALSPVWDRIEALVNADRAIRGRALLDGGSERLLATLGPHIRWNRPVLEVDYPTSRDLHLDGRGLLLVPSFFCWRLPIGLADPALPPVLAYPVARDVAPAGPHLDPLLGATRTAILGATRTSRSTGELALLLRVSAATASYHASVLRDAGLITSRRRAKQVLHTATPLGLSLLGGQDFTGP
ncbi:ArsR/SmtB family transcription factor [Nonomuraea insulae]|uniref:ArsR/SmtB family transcription factor n=1 Tax=Nonomuraea insulae TaxID=1616787 RepID=A0ABW1CP42_9ACTN